MELVVASGVIGVMFAALLSGLTSSVTNVQFGREQMRATQIMVEKLDTIRLYAWDELNTTYVPATFTESFSPGSNYKQGLGRGAAYQGTVSITNAPVTEPYGPALKQVTVSLAWQSGKRKVQSQMTTLVAQYGLQNYIR